METDGKSGELLELGEGCGQVQRDRVESEKIVMLLFHVEVSRCARRTGGRLSTLPSSPYFDKSRRIASTAAAIPSAHFC